MQNIYTSIAKADLEHKKRKKKKKNKYHLPKTPKKCPALT